MQDWNLIDQLGELALGSRLKRLSDYIMREGTEVYRENGIDFEPRWFPVYYQLKEESPLGITEIASRLGVSHPAVSQTVKELEKKGMARSSKDKVDGRKRLVSLTPKAKKMLPEMEKIWEDIARAMHDTLLPHRHHLLQAIAATENEFRQKAFFDRVKEITTKRQLEEVEIIPYAPELGDYFKSINYDWITEYFELEEIDRKVLQDHKAYILDRGGEIFFARYRNEIVGTCALIKISDDRYELAKMGVLPQYRGLQIGKKLGLAAIEAAEKRGAKTLFLDSNKRMNAAIQLYYRLGFVTVNSKIEESAYQRCDITMELYFND